MVSLVKKEKHGNIYLYLEHRVRKNGKSTRLFQIYLGPEKKFIQQANDFNFSLSLDYSFSILDFGLPTALMRIAQQLNLIDIINQATTKRNQGLSVGEYILIATLNRCIQPRSKSKLAAWFKSSYIQKLLPHHDAYLDANAYYHHFPYLTDEALETIESNIFQNLQHQFEIDTSQILYDPTNFTTYINPNPKEQQLPRHGRAKDKNYTLNIVGLSLFCTKADAIPIMHKTYPGNVQDAELFKTEFPRFLSTLQRRGVNLEDIILVFDKGNISQELFEAIDNSSIKWLCAVRPSSNKDSLKLVPAEFEMEVLPSNKLVGTIDKTHIFHGKKRRLLVSYNPARQRWNAKNFQAKLNKRYDLVVEHFKEKLNQKKWRDASKVEKKIKKEMGKKYLEFITYSITGEYGELELKTTILQDKVKQYIATLGKSFFSTNLENKALDIILIYRQQYSIERSFSYLKNRNTLNQLKVSPIYSWTDQSIQGHLFTCVLGLLLMMVLKREINKKFEGMSLEKIIDLLSEVNLVEIKMKGSSKIKKKLVDMSEQAKELCAYLKLEEMM